MHQQLNWHDKYALALKENITINEICLLRDCGRPKATTIRNKARQYCLENDIEYEYRKISTQVIFEITGLGLDYYYQKMLQERRLENEVN